MDGGSLVTGAIVELSKDGCFRANCASSADGRYWPNSAGSQQKELSEQRANPDLPTSCEICNYVRMFATILRTY